MMSKMVKTPPKSILKHANTNANADANRSKETKKRPKFFTISDSEDSDQSFGHKDNEEILLDRKEETRERVIPEKVNVKRNSTILYNYKMVKDLIEIISASTDGFLNRLEEELNYLPMAHKSNNSTSPYKELFIKKLKGFLNDENYGDNKVVSKSSKIKEFNNKLNKNIVHFMYKNNMALSDPEITKSSVRRQEQAATITTPLKMPTKKMMSPISRLLNNDNCSLMSSSLPSNGENILLTNNNDFVPRNRLSNFDAFEYEFNLSSEEELFNELFQTKSITSSNSFTNHKRFSFYNSNENNNDDDDDDYGQNTLVEANRTTKKIVRFADSLGLDLEKVQMISSFSNSSSSSDLYAIDISKRQFKSTKGDIETPRIKSKTLILIPYFSLMEIQNEMENATTKLADYLFDSDNKILKLLIRVKNISYEKHVFVRFTFNNWKTYNDIEAVFTQIQNLKNFPIINYESNSLHDYFIVTIFIPDCEQNEVYNSNTEDSNNTSCGYSSNFFYIEFAIYFKTESNTYWDNNFETNYRFQCLNQTL